MELHFHRWGQTRSGMPRLAFLHGMGGTGALWRPIAASLEDRYEILAPDQRGHGRSRPAGDGCTPLDYGRDGVETLEAQSFHPAFLIGHSMGVRTACAMAHLRPDFVSGLILIDLGFQGIAGGGLGEGLAAFLRKLPALFPSRSEARAFMTAECPDPSIAQYLMACSILESGGAITFPFDAAALMRTIEAARDVSIRGWVRAAGVRGLPILVLRGAESRVWSREDFEAERAAFLDLPSIVFEELSGCGHGLPFEKRLEFTQRIDRFVRVRRAQA